MTTITFLVFLMYLWCSHHSWSVSYLLCFTTAYLLSYTFNNLLTHLLRHIVIILSVISRLCHMWHHVHLSVPAGLRSAPVAHPWHALMPCCGRFNVLSGLLYIIAPTFATFTLSFDNCLPKLWASLYRQLAAMHICCIFLLKIWMLTCYIILILYFVSAIIKWPLSTITLCVFCSKLAQGSASMYYIHIEHQQRINVIRNCNKIWRKPFSTYPGKR